MRLERTSHVGPGLFAPGGRGLACRPPAGARTIVHASRAASANMFCHERNAHASEFFSFQSDAGQR